MCIAFSERVVFISLGYMLRTWCWVICGNILNWIKNNVKSVWLYYVSCPSTLYEQPSGFEFLPGLFIADMLYFGHSGRCAIASHCSFNLNSLRVDDVGFPFMYMHPCIPLVKCLLKSFAHILIGLCKVLLFRSKISFIFFWKTWFATIFFQSVFFSPPNKVFHRAKILNFDEIQFVDF